LLVDTPQPYKRWLPGSPDILDVCRTLIPKSFQNTISSTLYGTFWTLDLFDLYVPKQRYSAEVNRLNKEEECLLKQRRSAPSETHKFTPKDAGELQRVLKNANKLKDDELKQADHNKIVESTFFESNIKIFFPPFSHELDNMGISLDICKALDRSYAKAFLTICVFPRSLTSPNSAFYCAQFVQQLYHMNTPRFSTLQFFHYMIKATTGALMYLTEEEAQYFGILLETLGSIITDWRYGKDEFIDAKAAYERDVMATMSSQK
jgi:THO complex subunit 2